MKSRDLKFPALCAAIALVLASCGEPAPTSPRAVAAAPQADLLSPLTSTLAKTGLISCSPLPAAWATATIGPLGGTLRVGPHTFTVPSGALDGWVTITAYSPSSRYNQVEFWPQGLKFSKSASLSMSYANCSLLGDLLPKHIAYVDDDLSILYLLQSIDDILSQKVTGKVDHFSDYVVAW